MIQIEVNGNLIFSDHPGVREAADLAMRLRHVVARYDLWGITIHGITVDRAPNPNRPGPRGKAAP